MSNQRNTEKHGNYTTSAASFALLHPDFPRGCWLEESDENPLRFAVWCPVDEHGTEDIIGAADYAEDAIAQARKTVRRWAENDVSRAIELGKDR